VKVAVRGVIVIALGCLRQERREKCLDLTLRFGERQRSRPLPSPFYNHSRHKHAEDKNGGVTHPSHVLEGRVGL
jgi:hypothetical protein